MHAPNNLKIKCIAIAIAMQLYVASDNLAKWNHATKVAPKKILHALGS